MARSKQTLARAKAAARKAGTLPSRSTVEPRADRSGETLKPRRETRYAVQDAPVGALVMYKGAACILLEHRQPGGWARVLHCGRARWAQYRDMSLPPAD